MSNAPGELKFNFVFQMITIAAQLSHSIGRFILERGFSCRVVVECSVIFEGKISDHIIMSGSRSTSSIVRSEISIGRINSIGRSDRYNYESKQASKTAGMVYGICATDLKISVFVQCVAGFQVFCDCNGERGFMCE